MLIFKTIINTKIIIIILYFHTVHYNLDINWLTAFKYDWF